MRALPLFLLVLACSEPVDSPRPGGGTAPPAEPLTCDPVLRRVAGISTEVRGLVLRGELLFISDDHAGFRVLDVSDPGNPTSVSWLPDLVGLGRGLAMDGDIAYMTAADAGVYLIDVHNPAAPAVVGILDLPGYTRHVAVKDGFAYLADDWEGFHIADVSNPAAPTLVATMEELKPAFRLATDGDTVWLASGGVGVRVIDVRDKTHPVEVAVYPTPKHAWDVVLDEQTLYVADDRGGLRVFDVSDPVRGAPIGQLATSGEARSLTLVDKTLYLADGSSDLPQRAPEPGGHHGATGAAGLRKIDVTDPSRPVLLGTGDTAGYALTLTADDKRVVVGVNDLGLALFDATTLTANAAFSQLPGWATDIAPADGWTFVLTTVSLRSVDLTDPLYPVDRGQLTLPALGRQMLYEPGTAWIAASEAGLLQVDLTDPTAPRLDLQRTLPGSAADLVKRGDALAVATSAGVVWLDSAGAEPSALDSGDASVLTWLGDDLAVGGPAGVRVISPSGESRATLTTDPVLDIAADGERLVLAHGLKGVSIVALTGGSLTKLGSFQPPMDSRGVAVTGQYAYVTTYDIGREQSGLRLFDLSTPDAARDVTTALFRAPAERVVLSGNKAYVAATNFGLQIFEATCPR